MSETTNGIKSHVPQAPVDEFQKHLNYLRESVGTTEMEYQKFAVILHMFLNKAEKIKQERDSLKETLMAVSVQLSGI